MIDAAAADMRHVGRTVHPPFDAIVCFDNSLPHLLTDAEIVSTLVGFREVLAPSGILLVSIRDYGTVDRGGRAIHRYGERSRKGRRYRVTQEWEWYDADRYRTTMCIEERVADTWKDVVRASSRYYAIRLRALLTLFGQAGLDARIVHEPKFFQPVVLAVAE